MASARGPEVLAVMAVLVGAVAVASAAMPGATSADIKAASVAAGALGGLALACVSFLRPATQLPPSQRLALVRKCAERVLIIEAFNWLRSTARY